MPAIDFVIESEISQSTRAQQLSAMFDVPAEQKCSLRWQGELPIDNLDWNVGLIVGPSGSGKSTIAKQVFGEAFQPELKWIGASVIDDFASTLSMEDISKACQAVGFNTIPAWLRPFNVLSNGERFRVDLARRILELPDPIVVDEFSSVVDRQVAQIASYAVQKFVRARKRKFIAVGCHYDVTDWLDPDWILEPSTMAFTPRGRLHQRPPLDITISRAPYSAWKLFASYHYMSASLHPAARCYGLWVGDRIAAFAGILPKPISNGDEKGAWIAGVSRVVTLPDWQGMGLAFVLLDNLGAAYGGIGKRFRNYPAHPAFVRACQRSKNWRQTKQAGRFSRVSGRSANSNSGFGGRPCAVFEYVGSRMGKEAAQNLLAV